MNKFCVEQWNKNYKRLEMELKENSDLLGDCDYKYLVSMCVRKILNDVEDEDSYDYEWNDKEITEIDNGNYQGTLLYMIPKKACQPDCEDYLLTYVDYGSCSGCDALKHIQCNIGYYDGKQNATDENIKDFMKLCKDIVMNIVKPYNYGWRHDERFDTIEMKD